MIILQGILWKLFFTFAVGLIASALSFTIEINKSRLDDSKRNIVKKFEEYRMYSLLGSVLGIIITFVLLIWVN